MTVPKWMQDRGIEPTSAAARPVPTRIRGLGDVVHEVAKATGIASVVKRLAGDDCGCEQRREILNGLLPFGSKKKTGDN